MIEVHLVLRRPISDEYFSIERLFSALVSCLPRDEFLVRWHTCPWYSTGLLNRLKALLWVRRLGPGLVHITGDVNYLAIAVPRSRLIVTFHDLTTHNRLRGWRRWLFSKLWVEWPARRAARLVFISEASRAETLSLVPQIDSGKAQVIANCCTEPRDMDPRPFPSCSPKVLLVGTRPNKNLRRVSEALHGLSVRVCIIGPLTAGDESFLDALGLDWENKVALTDAQMREQYRKSDLVAFVPTYEGFGLPILEAQATGRPLVTSRRDPMRWVAGQGACLADPDSVGEIRDAIRRLLEDGHYRDSVIAAGFMNLQRFTPATAASLYGKMYRSLWSEWRA